MSLLESNEPNQSDACVIQIHYVIKSTKGEISLLTIQDAATRQIRRNQEISGCT